MQKAVLPRVLLLCCRCQLQPRNRIVNCSRAWFVSAGIIRANTWRSMFASDIEEVKHRYNGSSICTRIEVVEPCGGLVNREQVFVNHTVSVCMQDPLFYSCSDCSHSSPDKCQIKERGIDSCGDFT
jgi:hypothetical protein